MNTRIENIEKTIVVGLCKGRHDITEVTENGNNWIFPETIADPTDTKKLSEQAHAALSDLLSRAGGGHNIMVELYVTGLTVATTAVINWCVINVIPLTLMHYDAKSGGYYPQRVTSDWHYADLREGGYLA